MQRRFPPALLMAIACLVASAGAARAAATAPTVGGSYTLMTTELCQAQTQMNGALFVNGIGKNGAMTTAPAVSSLIATNPGSVSQSIGQISFTPTIAGGTSGKMSITLMQTSGSLTSLLSAANTTGTGAPISGPNTNVITGTYSTAANLITLTPSGKKPVVLGAIYANVSSTIAQTVVFVGQTSPGICAFQGIGLHQ